MADGLGRQLSWGGGAAERKASEDRGLEGMFCSRRVFRREDLGEGHEAKNFQRSRQNSGPTGKSRHFCSEAFQGRITASHLLGLVDGRSWTK